MLNSTDPWMVLSDALHGLRSELVSFNDKYAESIRQIWIKLTELDVKLQTVENKGKTIREDFKWVIPVIISLITMYLALKYRILTPF